MTVCHGSLRLRAGLIVFYGRLLRTGSVELVFVRTRIDSETLICYAMSVSLCVLRFELTENDTQPDEAQQQLTNWGKLLFLRSQDARFLIHFHCAFCIGFVLFVVSFETS